MDPKAECALPWDPGDRNSQRLAANAGLWHYKGTGAPGLADCHRDKAQKVKALPDRYREALAEAILARVKAHPDCSDSKPPASVELDAGVLVQIFGTASTAIHVHVSAVVKVGEGYWMPGTIPWPLSSARTLSAKQVCECLAPAARQRQMQRRVLLHRVADG